jgi:hypothetical protein
VGTTRHTEVQGTKETSYDLIGHARSRLLWRRRRRSIKGGTFLSKVATKLRVKHHVRDASIGNKWMRQIEVLIVGISLLEWSRRVALFFPRILEGKELCLSKELTLPPSYPFATSFGLFSPHVTLS